MISARSAGWSLIQVLFLLAQLQAGGLFFRMLDGFPPDQVIFQAAKEKFHPQAPGQTPQADIHGVGDEVLLIPALEPEELDVIDPDDLGPFQVNDLLVHEPFAHVDFIGLKRHQGGLVQIAQQS